MMDNVLGYKKTDAFITCDYNQVVYKTKVVTVRESNIAEWNQEFLVIEC